MVTDRLMEDVDTETLSVSLALSEHHKDTPISFFKQDGTMTKVYEDEQGPICFARVTKSLRLDIHFMNDEDKTRNASVLLSGFAKLASDAKANGFTEIVFTTNVTRLAKFCEKVFGYEVVSDAYVLRKNL